MIRRKKENIEWLEFEQLQEFPEVVHGVFLHNIKEGGHSLKIVSDFLDLSDLIEAKQVHGNRVELVPTEEKLECDGLITKEKDVGLLIKHADCQAAIFFDPVNKVIANIHSGWRGSVQNIYAKTVQKMQKEFGSNPKEIRVCISPSLGPENAEFVNYEKELPEIFFPFQARPYYFDFWEISKMQLKEMGILEKHIEIAGLCTFKEKKDFFSYRRDKKTGRHGTVVAIKAV